MTKKKKLNKKSNYKNLTNRNRVLFPLIFFWVSRSRRFLTLKQKSSRTFHLQSACNIYVEGNTTWKLREEFSECSRFAYSFYFCSDSLPIDQVRFVTAVQTNCMNRFPVSFWVNLIQQYLFLSFWKKCKKNT